MTLEIVREPLGGRLSENLLVVNRGPGAVEIPRDQGEDCDRMEIFFQAEQLRAELATSTADVIAFDPDRTLRKPSVFAKVVGARPELLDYARFLLADDDLAPVGCVVEDTFALFARVTKETGCRIAQPALAAGSYVTHTVTKHDPQYSWRRVNFVEVMAPLFTRAALLEYVEYFGETVSCWGLDSLWSAHEMRAGRPLAILDATPWLHSRPLYTSIAYQGAAGSHSVTSARLEGDRFMARHKVTPRESHALGGVAAGSDEWISLLTCTPPPQMAVGPCENVAAARFSWLLNRSGMICEAHRPRLAHLAEYIGIFPNIQPIAAHELATMEDPRASSVSAFRRASRDWLDTIESDVGTGAPF